MDRSQHTSIDYRPGKPVDRIAPVVFCHRKLAIGAHRRIDQGDALRHGQCDRLLDHHIEPRRECLDPDLGMGVRRGCHDHRVDLPDRLVHLSERGEDLRPCAQQIVREIRRAFGIGGEDVADPGELKWLSADVLEAFQPLDMAASHATATDKHEREHVTTASFSSLFLSFVDRNEREHGLSVAFASLFLTPVDPAFTFDFPAIQDLHVIPTQEGQPHMNSV